MADELLAELVKRAQADAPTMGMAPAGPDNQLNRAVWAMQKLQPSLMSHTDVTTMPWDDMFSGSNVLGATKTFDHQGPVRQEIRVNPTITMSSPSGVVEAVLAHELEHARQNRENPASKDDIYKELMTPYGERGTEKQAFEAEKQYLLKNHSENDPPEPDPSVFYHLLGLSPKIGMLKDKLGKGK